MIQRKRNPATKFWLQIGLEPRVLLQPDVVTRTRVRHRDQRVAILLPLTNDFREASASLVTQMPGLRVLADDQRELNLS